MDTTTIISDIHLGSDCCQAKMLEAFLENIESRSTRLILNGDVFDSMDFRRLEKHHWRILSRLRKISDKMEVVWVVGNHDGPAEVISHLLGLTVVNNYEFVSGGKKVLILHGHIFDEFIDNHPVLTWIGDMIYWLLQKLDSLLFRDEHYIARAAKHSSKSYLRCSEHIKERAIKLAKSRGCDVVCCGHTHNAEMSFFGSTQYINSGCWTEKPCHFIAIQEGIVILERFQAA